MHAQKSKVQDPGPTPHEGGMGKVKTYANAIDMELGNHSAAGKVKIRGDYDALDYVGYVRYFNASEPKQQ